MNTDAEELVKYYRKCVRAAELRVGSARDLLRLWETHLCEMEEELENSARRLREARKANEEVQNV